MTFYRLAIEILKNSRMGEIFMKRAKIKNEVSKKVKKKCRVSPDEKYFR